MQETLEWVAFIASGIAGVVCAGWYAKSKNNGHLFMAVAMLIAAAGFGYLALAM